MRSRAFDTLACGLEAQEAFSLFDRDADVRIEDDAEESRVQLALSKKKELLECYVPGHNHNEGARHGDALAGAESN